MTAKKTTPKTAPKRASTKAKATTPTTPETKPPTKKTPASAAKPKRLSALDAAVQVLRETGQALNTKELIAAMLERQLWSSPNGKTPHATLYAAILREITTKGDDARFTKTAKGHFAARPTA